jgi:hypothetical protein
MDFIEQIFGIAPDGGTGSLEFALLLLPIAILYLVYRRVFGAKRR